VVDQEIDERGVDGGSEEVGADARAVHQQDRPALGRPGPLTWIKFKSMPSPA